MAEPASYEADLEVSAVGSIIGNRTFKLHVAALRGPDSSSNYLLTPNIPGSVPISITVDSLGAISTPSPSGLKLARKGPVGGSADSALKGLLGLGRAQILERDASNSAHRLRFVSTVGAARFRQLAAALRSSAASVVQGANDVTYTGRVGEVSYEVRLDRNSDAPVFQRMQWSDGRVLELTQTFDDVGNGVFARVGMSARVHDAKGESTFSTNISNLVVHGVQK